MPLNFRSALHITAGNSTAAMRQTGARALWWNEREHSPHSMSWRAPAVICPIPTALWAAVITASGTGCSKPRTRSKPSFWGGRGPIWRDLLVTALTQSWLLALLLSLTPTDLPGSPQGTEQSVLFRTGNFEPRQKRLSGHFSLKGNEFFLKEHQVEVGAVLSPVLSTF